MRPRSGLALKQRRHLAQRAWNHRRGLSRRGQVILINHGEEAHHHPPRRPHRPAHRCARDPGGPGRSGDAGRHRPGGGGSARPASSDAPDPRLQHLGHAVEPRRAADDPPAAARAPLANRRRSRAEWASVRISSSAAKTTLCSPTMSPPRMTEKPIVPGGRSPMAPSCGGARTGQVPAAAPGGRLAQQSAVPDGASRLRRWWASEISMSQASAARRRAACLPTRPAD